MGEVGLRHRAKLTIRWLSSLTGNRSRTRLDELKGGPPKTVRGFTCAGWAVCRGAADPVFYRPSGPMCSQRAGAVPNVGAGPGDGVVARLRSGSLHGLCEWDVAASRFARDERRPAAAGEQPTGPRSCKSFRRRGARTPVAAAPGA